MTNRFSARVNDEHEFDLSEEDLDGLDVINNGEDAYHIIHRNRSVSVRILKSEFSSGYYLVEINGASFEVTLNTPLDHFIREMGFGSREGSLVDKVVAPMPGLLLDIYVKEGQEVEKDDPLLVLEAMKMENVILSPRKGIIGGILYQKGKTVDKGTELISFT